MVEARDQMVTNQFAAHWGRHIDHTITLKMWNFDQDKLLVLFSGAAITKYHKPNGLKNRLL